MSFARRAILKFIGGAVVGVVATPIIWKGIDDTAIWSQNWPWIPKNMDGETIFAPAISKLCPSNQGLLVQLTGGRPVRTHGNPGHPLSLGGLSALAAAEVQLLYSPARVKRPMRRNADGSYAAISWDEAMKALVEGLRGGLGQNRLACVTGDECGTISEFFSAFTVACGSAGRFFAMPGEAQAGARAWELSGGSGQIGYDIEKADYILALGANVLESWGTAIRNRRIFAAQRPHGEAPALGLAYAGPVQNNTASVADVWLPIKPGTEAAVALGLANLLIAQGASADAPGFAEFKALAASFTPDMVKAVTGLEPQRLEAVAKALAGAKRPLVIAGSSCDQGGGTAPILAGLALNALLGGLRGGIVGDLPIAGPVVARALSRTDVYKNDLAAFAAGLAKGEAAPAALVVYEANPVYGLPRGKAFAKALETVPFKVAFTSFFDETAACCNLVLPIPMGLERADDADTPYGCGTVVYTQSAPVVKPLVDARPADAVLIAAAKELNIDLGLASLADAMAAKAAAYGAKMKPGQAYKGASGEAPYSLRLRPDVIAAALKQPAPAGKLGLALVERLSMGTANSGIPPFNTKTIRHNELSGEMACVMVNGATAADLKVGEGDRVNVYSGDASITALVSLSETVASGAAAVLLGLGHTALDEFSRDKGANVMDIIPAEAEPASGLFAWSRARVDIVKA